MPPRLLVLSGSIGMFACALGVDACSSNEAPSGDSPDASQADARDATVSLPAEAEAPCDPHADLLANVQDASIADGASTTGLCAGCLRNECAAVLATCSENCPCQGIMRRAIDCYLTSQRLACVGELTSYLVTPETRADALQVLGCVQSSCAPACAVDAGSQADAGADADAGDGG